MSQMLRALPVRKASSAHGRKPKSAHRARPGVEVLEPREVPTVTPHGGAVLPHVKVQGLYVGDQWARNPALYAQAGYLEGFLKNIVNSSYMDALTSAGYGVGRGSFTTGRISLASLAYGRTLDDSTIRSWLSYYVGSRTLQAADANTVYVCFVEPNVLVRMGRADSHNQFLGYHGAFTGPGGAAVRYAVIAYPGGATNNAALSFLPAQDGLTEVASHEIAEAATDPDVNYRALGWYDDALNAEAGDVTEGRVVYLNGYAVQRIADRNDRAMTPAGATARRAVSFVLETNGSLWMRGASGWTYVISGVASVSDQGVDNQGRAMVDLVTTSGLAYEYHEGGGWAYLGFGVKSARAGQGVSYVLFSNGGLYEYDDATARSQYVSAGISQIDAGTDRVGVNCVDVVFTWGDAWERSDSSGWHFIAGGVQSISAGQQGISDYVTTAAVAHWHRESDGADVALAGNVAQVTAGSDPAGGFMIDLLFKSGDLYEYRGGSWQWIDGNVQSIAKARAGVLDVLFSWGGVWEHRANSGWTYLTDGARQVA